MKNILKVSLIFVLGLLVGGAITGVFIDRFYENYLARLYVIDLSANAMFARQIRQGDAEIVARALESNLPQQISEVYTNERFKNTPISELALKTAKEFYVCTKTEIPAEIVEILNKLPPVPESSCEGINK
jgi:hypothetical protein